MDTAHQLTVIFCQFDDFCKSFKKHMASRLLSERPAETSCHGRKRGPAGLSDSEIMTILAMSQKVRFRDFKTFYAEFALKNLASFFPKLPCYARFVAIMKRVALLMTLFTAMNHGKDTGIYYIDSTCLPVCHIKRSKRHATFEDCAAYGKTSTGWFFGLKLHLVINHQGEIMAFKLTSGNRADSKTAFSLFQGLTGLGFGDKGYLGEALKQKLSEQKLSFITRRRKNMKSKDAPISDYEQHLLNQRGMIETVIGHLKHHYHIWHTRHRSVVNAMTHMVSALAAYAIEPLKMSAIRLLGQMGRNP